MKGLYLPAIVFTVSLFFAGSCKLMDRKVEKSNGTSDTTATISSATPAWVMQSNVYEVNLRQYSKAGTFKAFAAHLPRLKEMGVDILWFMPITPISKTDRKGTLGSYYAVADYYGINPDYGTLEDFNSLVNEAHQQGFKVIVDWVANHSGADNAWLQSHPDFYMKDSTGKAKFAFDWSDTRELNYDNREMRDSMIRAMKYWIKETPIDGFRCDVAAEVPSDFWRECITELRKSRPLFMLAEADKGELHESGFDASYAWDMFQTMKKIAAGSTNALALDSVLQRQDSTFPKQAIRLYFTSNHDENSWNKSDYGTFPGEKHAPFAVLTQTLRGSLPLIYSGQEEPVLRKIEFFEKDTMEFGKYERAPFYEKLLEFRKNNPAMAVDATAKKIITQDDKSIYAFEREKNGSRIIVITNLSGNPVPFQPKEKIRGAGLELFTGTSQDLSGALNLAPWSYHVYSLSK